MSEQGESNEKGKINKTVSWERLQLILRAGRKTKQMMQSQLPAPHTEESRDVAQRQTSLKHVIDGLISPQGTNTIRIHFSLFYFVLCYRLLRANSWQEGNKQAIIG